MTKNLTKEQKHIYDVMLNPKKAIGYGKWAKAGRDYYQVKFPLESAYTIGNEKLTINHYPATNSYTLLVMIGRNVARLETWMQAEHTQSAKDNLPVNHLPINRPYEGPHLHPWLANLPYTNDNLNLPIATLLDVRQYTLHEALTLFCSDCAILLESIDIEPFALTDSLFSE